MAAMNIVLQFV